MKDFWKHIISFVVGALMTALVFLLLRDKEQKIEENGVLVKTETITKIDTVVVTKEKLKTEIIEKEGKTEYVYVEVPPEVVKDTVYKVIPLKKKYYLTVSNDMEIYHSGVFSQIDSVVNYRETKTIKKIYRNEVKNDISVGMEAGYALYPSTPIYLRYERMLHKNVGIYGKAYYDFYSRHYGVSAGVRVKISW